VDKIETIIVGGGQAGLSISYYLTQQGREHLILEQAAQPADAWRNQRWDSFSLVTPNWQIRLPGAEYQGADPDGYMPRAELVRYFEDYIQQFKLPIRCGVRVTSVEQTADGYHVQAGGETFEANNVVIATGLFQTPKIPPFSANLSSEILQIHSTQYRNPQILPPGAVLIVGSAQSGCQIADELHQHERKVYISVGGSGRIPRRYRGHDTLWWLFKTGFFDRTVDKLPSPRMKFAPNPQVSGAGGGRSLNLHQFARNGIVLLGRIQDIQGSRITFAPDLKENLAKTDKLEADMLAGIDKYIEQNGLDAPAEIVPQLRDGYEAEEILSLDVREQGITSVIWACGYTFDFSLVKLPVFDADGYPIQQRGVSAYPGLYFLGLPWLHKPKSGLLSGVGEDAAFVAAHIGGRG
jgi:putative flavoprotein involved in K+ transport